jgi:hypothetical protein
MDERITVMLSVKEMLYMAAHLGMRINSLLGDPYKGYPEEAIREEMIKGRESLEGRNLIRQVGAREWEVEGRLDSIMRFIKNPDNTLILSFLRKGEEGNRVLFHFQGKEVASVVFKNAYYYLSLYRDEEMLMKYLQPMMGVGQQLSQNTPGYRVPPADLSSLLMTAWQGVEDCAETLRARGLTAAEASQIAGFLAQTLVFDTLILILRDPNQPVKQYQAVLLGNASAVWWFDCSGVFPEMVSLEALPALHAIARVRRFLHPGPSEPPIVDVEEEIII